MSPRVIDLFSGAGGLSLGAARADFEVAAAVEIDPYAISTHERNFPATKHLALDVSKLSGTQLLEYCGMRAGELDGLIGGPPCQGFSVIGRRSAGDTRNSLFSHFFRLVAETKPAFFVAENVPGLLNPKYEHVLRDAAAKLPMGAYRLLKPVEVQANLYGAPTVRRRLFFIGYLPDRFSKELTEEDFRPPSNVEVAYVERALRGLPLRIDGRWQTEELGWRKVESLGEGYYSDRITNSVPAGIGDVRLLERYFERGEVSGCLGTKHSPALKRRYAALAPGETDPTTKSTRLNPQGFCPTLRAGTGVDKGSFQAVRPIHYSRPRVITPREAARLQGFPDWFVFHHTKWQSFRQIGNSVSPIVAERVLSPLRSALR